MKISHAYLDFLLLGAFFFVFVYSLWTASVGWNTSLNLSYDFVQAKAAIVAYYIAQGGPILHYELPVFGPPWSVPYEFPFYQTAVAWTHNLTGLPLESAARVIAKLFFYLSCIPLVMIARVFGFRGKTILIPLTLFLASPIYLFWSRQFMNESVATFLGLAYLAMSLEWQQKQNNAKWFLAITFGVMAALAKSTTYIGFGVAAGLYFLVTSIRNHSYKLAPLARALAVIVVPLIASILWVRYTDAIKWQNPLAADSHTSAALAKWYLSSDWHERTNGALWYHFFRNTIPDAVGHRAAWILSVLLAFVLGKKAWLYWLCSAFFLVAPLLFPQVHLVHDYYANANAVFLVFAFATLIERAATDEKKWMQVLGVLLFVLVIRYEVREFMSNGYKNQQTSRSTHISFAKKLQSVVATGDILLSYGEDWCPIIPYYSERRAIMMQNDAWYNPRLKESLALLKAENKKVGAVMLCYDARTDKKLLSTLSLGPLLLRDICDVYGYR